MKFLKRTSFCLIAGQTSLIAIIGFWFVAATFFVGCSTGSPKGGLNPYSKMVRGFVPYETPRTFHPPGTILRIDNNGVDHTVTVITNVFQDLGGQEAFPDLRSTNKFSAHSLLTFLTGTSKTAKAGAGVTNTSEVVLSMKDAKREILGEDDYDKIIKQAIRDKQISWRTNSQYQIIMETVSTKKLTAKVDKLLVAGANAEGTITSYLNGTIGFAVDRGNYFDLTRTFTTEYRVLYKSAELEVSSFGATGEIRVKRKPSPQSYESISF